MANQIKGPHDIIYDIGRMSEQFYAEYQVWPDYVFMSPAARQLLENAVNQRQETGQTVSIAAQILLCPDMHNPDWHLGMKVRVVKHGFKSN